MYSVTYLYSTGITVKGISMKYTEGDNKPLMKDFLILSLDIY